MEPVWVSVSILIWELFYNFKSCESLAKFTTVCLFIISNYTFVPIYSHLRILIKQCFVLVIFCSLTGLSFPILLDILETFKLVYINNYKSASRNNPVSCFPILCLPYFFIPYSKI